jgi:antitoxin MazE
MRSKISRWGNSLGVRIPKESLEAAGFREGEQVSFNARNGVIELRPIKKPVTLADLVAEAERLGPSAVSPTVEWGPDLGSEIIDDAYSRGEITLQDILSGRAASKRR